MEPDRQFLMHDYKLNPADDFAGWLIGSKRAQIDLAKAGIACISVADEPRKGGGALVWLVTPEWY